MHFIEKLFKFFRMIICFTVNISSKTDFKKGYYFFCRKRRRKRKAGMRFMTDPLFFWFLRFNYYLCVYLLMKIFSFLLLNYWNAWQLWLLYLLLCICNSKDSCLIRQSTNCFRWRLLTYKTEICLQYRK